MYSYAIQTEHVLMTGHDQLLIILVDLATGKGGAGNGFHRTLCEINGHHSSPVALRQW